METISAEKFKAVLNEKPSSIQIVDVREEIEFAQVHLNGSVNRPLSRFGNSAQGIDADKPLYLLCRSGARAGQAAKKLDDMGVKHGVVIEGGIEALKSAGIALAEGETKVWAMDRQVRMGAGAMVLLGVLGSWWVHPNFIYLSLFVSCGLIFSAVTNTCGMALMLAKCPWNRVQK